VLATVDRNNKGRNRVRRSQDYSFFTLVGLEPREE
jgi:hypothetical protein